MPTSSVIIYVVTDKLTHEIRVQDPEVLPRSPKLSCSSSPSKKSAESSHRVSVEIASHSGKTQVIYSEAPLSLLASTFRSIEQALDVTDATSAGAGFIEKIILPKPTFKGKKTVLDVMTTAKRRQCLKDNLLAFDSMLNHERQAGTGRQVWLSLIPDGLEHWQLLSVASDTTPRHNMRQTAKIISSKRKEAESCPSSTFFGLGRLCLSKYEYPGHYQRAVEGERASEDNDDLAGTIM